MQFSPELAAAQARNYSAAQRRLAATQEAAINAREIRITSDYPNRTADGSPAYKAYLYSGGRSLHSIDCDPRGITADGTPAAEALLGIATHTRDKALATATEQDGIVAAIEAGTYVVPTIPPARVRTPQRKTPAKATARRTSSWDRVASGRR